MKYLFFILIMLALIACGKKNDSPQAPSTIINSEVVNSKITFNGSTVQISGSGVCGYETFRGRIYLDFCKKQTGIVIPVLINIPGFTLVPTITPDWVDITTYFESWPIDPKTMTGTIQVGGV